MSRSVADMRRRQAALSTSNRDFVPTNRLPGAPRENLNDEDDEDVRLEKYRTQQQVPKLKAIAQHSSRGRRVVEVYEDSPNGYAITAKAPHETERAVKYYSFHLRHFTGTEHPEEYGLIHYSLGKVFFADRRPNQKDYNERAKAVENALYHFRLALEVFEYNSHPILFGVICTFVAQCFRERATMISSRSILAKRGVTVADSIRVGISQLEEALPALQGSKFHTSEYALCSLELGWLYIMQVTEATQEEREAPPEAVRARGREGRAQKGREREKEREDELIEVQTQEIYKEQAILALDRALVLVVNSMDPAMTDCKPRGNKWNPAEPATHPHHIKLLLRSQPLTLCQGISHYLLGRCYEESQPTLDNMRASFDHFCKACRPDGLPMEMEEWADAHHRAAGLAVRHPQVVDAEFGVDPSQDTDLCFTSAITHLQLALRCPTIKPQRRLDLLFHLAQANIARLNMITDRVPSTKSVYVTIMQGEGLEIVNDIKGRLLEAIRGSTAANMESTQDAYVYYFSCLKLSELRMMEAAATPDLTPEKRDKLLEQSVIQLVNALLARSIVDNTELHYIACSQLSAMLLAARRSYAATKCYGKVLLCLSAMSNRLSHLKAPLRALTQVLLWGEMEKQVGQALLSSNRDVEWRKQHLGAVLLTESVTSGFAYWSFERHPSHGDLAENAAAVVEKPKTYTESLLSRKPPALLPPFMTDDDRKKNDIVGKVRDKSSSEASAFSAPAGAVPLWAMGHHPSIGGAGSPVAKRKKGMFGNRRRSLVPHLPHILGKVANITNKRGGDVVYLMPLPTISSTEGGMAAKVSFKIKDQDIASYMRNKEKEKRASSGGKSKGGMLSLFGRVTGLFSQERAEDEDENAPPPPADLYSSVQGFYTLMVLSRLDRTQLVHQCARLRVGLGRRVFDCLARLDKQTAFQLEAAQKRMRQECAGLDPPNFTLRELSARSFEQLSVTFKTQAGLAKAAADLESLIYGRVAREDAFLPLALDAQALCRDIGGFDSSLLNANILVSNLRQAAAQTNTAAAAAAAAADANTSGIATPAPKSSPAAPAPSATQQAAMDKAAGKMTFDLSQTLDGALQPGGTASLLGEHLLYNECLLVWHVPPTQGLGMQLVVVWRDKKRPLEPGQRGKDSNSNSNSNSSNTAGPRGPAGEELDVIVELCKTDIDSVQLQYLVKNFLDALESAPEVRRLAFAHDALRSLSGYLALTEVLLLLPQHVDSLAVSCPNAMRLVPWHLVYVETVTAGGEGGASVKSGANTKTSGSTATGTGTKAAAAQARNVVLSGGRIKPSKDVGEDGPSSDNVLETEDTSDNTYKAVHLTELYTVRLAPTLTLFELTEAGKRGLQHYSGMHKLCCIDGDEREDREGIRAAEIECVSVTATFSGDPDDVALLSNALASPLNITTADNTTLSLQETQRRAKLRELREAAKEAARRKKQQKREAEMKALHGTSRYTRELEDEPERGFDSEGSVSSDDEEAISNRKVLRDCRVLHIAARRAYSSRGPFAGSSDDREADRESSAKDAFAAGSAGGREGVSVRTGQSGVRLPMYYDSSGEYGRDTRQALSSTDVIKQISLTNCGLCVLSRFALSDGARDKDERDANLDFLDAFHLVGASTLIYPMWQSLNQGGLATLSSIVFLLKFYMELPTFSRLPRSVSVCVRSCQAWLREATADEVIAFVSRCPIPEKARLAIIEEMEATIDNSLKNADRERFAHFDAAAYDGEGNKVRPGDRKFFTHFLLWGAFVVSGAGGGVHPPELTEPGEDPEDGTALRLDRDLENVHLEIAMLRQEGRFREAKQLTRRLREQQAERIKLRLQAAQRVTAAGMRKIMDAFEALDKALLDQDEDAVDIDSDEGKGKGKGRGRTSKERGAKDLDDENDDEEGGRVQLRSEVMARARQGASADDSDDAAAGASPVRTGVAATTTAARRSGASSSGRYTATFNPTHRSASVPYKPSFLNPRLSATATPTPISKLTQYVEGLFADAESELDSVGHRPKRLIAVDDEDEDDGEGGDMAAGGRGQKAEKSSQKYAYSGDDGDDEEDDVGKGARGGAGAARARDTAREMLDHMPESRACTVM